MKTILLLLLTLLNTASFCQIPIDSFYVDKESFLIESHVEEFDTSITSTEIIKRIKNWGGTNFVNVENVLVGETNDQLVFNFITNSVYHKGLGMKYKTGWYVRLVVQVKENRVRFLFYDDGNAYIPGTYSGTYKVPAVQARTRKISSMYANKNGIIRNNSEEGVMVFKEYIKNTSKEIVEYVKNPFSTNSKVPSDW